jgi:hypothetical protein
MPGGPTLGVRSQLRTLQRHECPCTHSFRGTGKRNIRTAPLQRGYHPHTSAARVFRHTFVINDPSQVVKLKMAAAQQHELDFFSRPLNS